MSDLSSDVELLPLRALQDAVAFCLLKDQFRLRRICRDLQAKPDQKKQQQLQNCIKDKDFKDKVLMALDSNNETARKRALEVVAKTRDVETMRGIVTALSENRNPDTWKTVYSNIGLIEDTSKLHEFTDQVFLSRRKARSAKESIKNTIDQLLSELEEMVSQRVLIRMSRSSVASDREWALQKIVSGQLIVDDLIIEETWKI